MFQLPSAWRQDRQNRVAVLADTLPSQRAFRIFVRYASEVKIIVGKSRYILEAIHSENVLCDGPAWGFRKWLQKEENSVGSGRTDIGRLHREFHASHLQRSFLARALGLDPQITCMGSIATAAYCSTVGECRWLPSDMDLFMVKSRLYYKIKKMYKREVCEPLGLALNVADVGSSLSDETDSDSNQLHSDSDEAGFDEDPNDEAVMEDEGVRVEELAPYSDRLACPSFVIGRNLLNRNRADAIRSELETFVEGLPPADREASRTELFKLLDNLPLTTVGSPSEIVRSTTLLSKSSNAAKPPRVLKPINLILLRPKLVRWCKDIQDPVVFRRFIAAGFDLLHNCIAINVDKNLRIDTLQVEAGAYDAARLSHLRLREATLQSPPRTFVRLYKYIKRDYRWPG